MRIGLLLAGMIFPLLAQQPLVTLTAVGGGSRTWYRADVKQFEQLVECGRYRSGEGWSAAAMFTGEYHWSDRWSVGLGIGYADYSGEMVNTGRYSYRDSTAMLRTAVVSNILESTWRYFQLMPFVRAAVGSLLPNSFVTVAAGLPLSLAIQSDYVQRQRFDPQSSLVFIVNGRRLKERVLASGSVQSRTPLLIHGTVQLMHHLQIATNWRLVQSLQVFIPFNSLSSTVDWSAYQLTAAFGLQYVWHKAPPVQIPSVPVPTVTPQPVVPKVQAQLQLEFPQGVHWNVGNELVATLPIVNAVFFERNQAVIPERYIQHPVPSTEIDAVVDAVDYHRYVLPVLARIAAENPEAQFELVGATSGREDEPAGEDLARRRAEAVAEALQRLGVPKERIRLRWQLLPPNPSNQQFPEGREENRRVDIRVYNAPLLRYVRAQRFRELEGALHVAGTIQNAELEQHPAKLVITSPIDTLLPIRHPDFQLAIPFQLRLSMSDSIIAGVATLNVPTHPPVVVRDTTLLRLDTLPQVEVELRLDRFEAILRFEYNSSILSVENQQLLRQLVELLPAGSTIVVYGSSDTLGTEHRNRVLAQQRADNVSQFLEQLAPQRYRIIAQRFEGRKFSEHLPEGRFLNRSIRLRVFAADR